MYNHTQVKFYLQKHLKLLLRSRDGAVLDGIAFNVDTKRWPDLAVREVQVAYQLQLNHFRGATNVQLLVEHLQPLR